MDPPARRFESMHIKHADVLKSMLTAVPDGEEKDDLVDFLMKILVWNPEERADATELLGHTWFDNLPPGSKGEASAPYNGS